MTKKLTREQEQQIAEAIRTVRALRPGQGMLPERWATIRDAALALRASLNGRPPTLDEIKLIEAGEKVSVWLPVPVRLVDQATDDATRREVEDWIRRSRGAQEAAREAEAAYNAKRTEVVRDLAGRIVPNKHGVPGGSGAVYLSESMQLERGLKELELAATRARCVAQAVEEAFANWRIRAWTEGRLRDTNGIWE